MPDLVQRQMGARGRTQIGALSLNFQHSATSTSSAWQQLTLQTILELVVPDEKVDCYIHYLAPLLNHGIETSAQQLLSQMGYPKVWPPLAPLQVLYLKNLASVWLRAFAPVQVQSVPRNVRLTVLVYKGQDVDWESYEMRTLNLQFSLEPLLKELFPLRQFSWNMGRLQWSLKDPKREQQHTKEKKSIVPRYPWFWQYCVANGAHGALVVRPLLVFFASPRTLQKWVIPSPLIANSAAGFLVLSTRVAKALWSEAVVVERSASVSMVAFTCSTARSTKPARPIVNCCKSRVQWT